MKSLLGEIVHKLQDRIDLYRYIKSFTERNVGRVVDPENTILLFCQPRSGSTWLAEILLNIPHSCLIDEPLWRGHFEDLRQVPPASKGKVREVGELGFYNLQPIPETDQWQEASLLLEKLITGCVPTLHLYKEADLRRLKNADLYITKFNYGQLLMHWLVAQFNTKNILLIRHPCAVVSSQMRFRGFFRWDPQLFITKDFRFSEVFHQYRELCKEFRSPEEWLAFLWALQVKHSFYHPQNDPKRLTLSYEGMVTRFEEEVSRLFNYLGREIPGAVIQHKFKPSDSTSQESAQQIKEGNQLGQWRDQLKKEEIGRILGVVESMGVTLYDDSLEPDYDLLYRPASQ